MTGEVARAIVSIALLLFGCSPQGSTPTSLEPGTVEAPRELNLIARDYLFLPPTLDVVPGEVVVLHVVNGGLDVHEAIIGDDAVQAAWEEAEAAAAGGPPGPTPVVSVPADVSGLRIVVGSGQRVDVTWTVPTDGKELTVGCHIPGHWEKGMRIPVRFVQPGSS